MKTKLIPASALPEITRQLETQTTKEIAAGLNLDICHVKRFIAEHNVSALDIKQEYRKRVVRLNPNASMGELVAILKCSYITVRRAIADVLAESKQTIPDSDAHLVIALLDTLTAVEVMQKWEATQSEFTTYIQKHGISIAQIKFDYRVEIINKNIEKTNFDLSIIIGCSESTVLNTKIKMKEMRLL